LTDTSQLRGGPERTGMPDIDHARNRAESALNALSRDQGEHSPAYWVGSLESALEGIIADLRGGA
jgi:hypothetical protein